MTSPVPASVPSDGNLRTYWVPVLADPAAPTLAELNAAGSVDLSCYLTGSGYTPSLDEAAVTDDRLCSREDFERPGRIKNGLALQYVYRPQEPVAATNKAFTTLKHLTAGYVVSRWGMPYETAFATTQVVDVLPVQCGVQDKMPPEGNSVLKIGQKMFVTGKAQRDVAVV